MLPNRDQAEMAAPHRDRDPIAERQEQLAFLLLQHIFSVTGGDPAVELPDGGLARDLAFERREALPLIDHLVMAGYVRSRPDGGLCITPEGVDYMVRSARSRRSVRSPSGFGNAPGLHKWVPRPRD